MEFIDWIISKKSGAKRETDEYIQIIHDDGNFSHFYYKTELSKKFDMIPRSIKFLYREFDGIDLFSSTFKVCSIERPVIISKVTILSSLSTLREKMTEIKFPEPSVSFLNETGNWIYAASTKSDNIYSFDVEYGDIGVYNSVYEIIENWINATTS